MPEERRVVTILFADITGSTALGETTDPEDVRAVLGRYYAIARDVIGTHGGTLEKFIGDAVMAVFGVPQAHGDDAERALAAALALRAAVAADPQTAALALRIGVNTGEVVAARDTGAGDFLVTGDAVNIAARLQQGADPGAVLVGERTVRAATGFRFGDEQRITAKGKSQPIVAAALIGQAERRAPRAPFLGREHDLAQLDLVAQRAFSERRPQLVTITAPAGTGKSRLVEEFASRLDPAPRRAIAQCLPYGSAVTFLPLRGLVRGLLGVADEGDVLVPLRDAFGAAGYAADDAQRLAALIGMTLGDAPETERADRDEVFAAWRLLVETLAARGPLLVVFEDLHWASDTLLDLVEHITTSRTSAPLVMVALARPELLDRRPTWGGGRRNFTSLALEPLTPDEARRLVQVMTEGVPAPIAERIVERTGGNPFFVGELVRAYEAGRRSGVRDEEISLPDTVHGTVLARIDALPAAERAVLERAAVAGRTARAAAVAALLPDLSTDAADAIMTALADRDLLVPQGGGAYTFRHIVIREVAYATLPRAERVRAHLRLAEWFEQDAPARANELAELVAYHYRQAIALSPGRRVPEGVDPAGIVAALERAARIASQAGGFGEVRQLLTEAIALAPAAEHLRLQELLGDQIGFGDATIEAYGAALDIWRADPRADPAVGARLAVKRLGVIGRWSGSISHGYSPEEEDAMIAEARALLERAPDELLAARLACAETFPLVQHRTTAQLTPELVAEYERRLIEARRLFAQRGEQDAESEALDALSAIYRDGLGDLARSVECHRARLATLHDARLLERIDAWGMLGWDGTYAGDYAAAERVFADMRAARRPGEPEFMLAHGASWSAYAAMLLGHWDTTLAITDWLVDIREEGPVGRFVYAGLAGAIRVARARMDDTRLARYRAAFAAIADLANLTPEVRTHWTAVLDQDAAAARAFFRVPSGSRDRKSELLVMVLFECRERVPDDELDALAAPGGRVDPPLMRLRLALARALNAGPAALRAAIADLDAGDLVSDAARASALLALATHDVSDRADAERRLGALGDRVFLQVLAEEW